MFNTVYYDINWNHIGTQLKELMLLSSSISYNQEIQVIWKQLLENFNIDLFAVSAILLPAVLQGKLT